MPPGAGLSLRHNPSVSDLSHEDRVGRPMVRYLLDIYSIEQIQRLFEEEACALPLSPSLFSPPQAKEDTAGDNVCSISSEPEPSPSPATSNIAYQTITTPPSSDAFRTAFKPINSTFLSTTAAESNFESSDIASSGHAIVHQRKEESTVEDTLLIPVDNNATANTENSTLETPTKKQKEYICGFCSEYGVYKRLSRPSDLKRHLESTHHTNNLWVCPKANCRRVFQWLGAFKEHARHYHKVRIRICDAEVITLCPQTVFACGFEGCSQVYEALSKSEVSPARDKFIAHVVCHLQSPLEKPRAWTFTYRMHNLLSQSALSNVWPPPSLSHEKSLQLSWDARSGSVLQKLLETRHIGNPSSLIQNAIALGSVSCREVQLAPGNAVLPVLDQCQAEVHQIDLPTVQTTLSPAEAADATAESEPVTANCSESLISPGYSDALESVFQPEQSHEDVMQEILDSLPDQHPEQHYLAEGFTDPMEWIENNDVE